MSEFETDQDSFDNVFDSQDLEMTAAFEEQYVSSQAAPFFAALDDGPLPRTDFPSAPSPVQAPPPSPSAPPALHQHHHDYNPQLPQRRHSPTPSQRESEMHELECLNLKRKVQSKSAQQPSTSTQNSKRVFPQAPPRPKSKIRKTAKTRSQSLRSTSSSEIANAMESIHLSSQHPSPAIRQLSSMQSPTLSTQHYTPSVKPEPLSVSDPRAIPPPVPPNTASRSALPPRLLPPSSSTANHLDATKQIFDVFKETYKRKTAKLNMVLVPKSIPNFARQFCSKLKPPDGACSSNTKEILSLLVSDIEETIIRSENPSFTIPSLLALFNQCLPICIDEKLHDIIATIVTVMQRLVTFSATAADQLVKGVKLNLTNSSVYNLVLVLAMYSFKTPPTMYYVVKEFQDVVHANSNDIIILGQKCSTMSREIAEALEYKQTPPQARETVRCILSILSVVGAGHSKST
ncbi:hypothetical protein MUCCIDRAFT_159764 [Mucor lusitanicus CBS 277.49]|uniref:Uncharacterized protein n=1 Tax=Mucor lusitanicus CBS 277.49 TaxID=747725 RepID=A0A168NC29_MUCCL|nr:hypothetical protein MUCCIDRAFT_159764 [Mucor lusitanicus CBS 277.49]